jgi:drug/metabolite transporter (DMT)-like permease
MRFSTAVLVMVVAGAAWGFTFVAPALAPLAAPWLLATGRFVVFGLAALPQLTAVRAVGVPWGRAIAHALTGSVIYYALLVAAIRLAGPTIAVAVIGLIPVVTAVLSVRRDGGAVRPLVPALVLLGCGQVLVHSGGPADSPDSPLLVAGGVLLALAALASWTWYGLDSMALLRGRPELGPVWASAQGLAAAGLSAPVLLGGLVVVGASADPLRVIAVTFALGLLSSWLAVRLWNAASPALPGHVNAQLLSLETAWGFVLAAVVAGVVPGPTVLLGELLIVLGCAAAVARTTRRRAPAPRPERSPTRR